MSKASIYLRRAGLNELKAVRTSGLAELQGRFGLTGSEVRARIKQVDGYYRKVLR